MWCCSWLCWIMARHRFLSPACGAWSAVQARRVLQTRHPISLYDAAPACLYAAGAPGALILPGVQRWMCVHAALRHLSARHIPITKSEITRAGAEHASGHAAPSVHPRLRMRRTGKPPGCQSRPVRSLAARLADAAVQRAAAAHARHAAAGRRGRRRRRLLGGAAGGRRERGLRRRGRCRGVRRPLQRGERLRSVAGARLGACGGARGGEH